jgi:hypothetical protein
MAIRRVATAGLVVGGLKVVAVFEPVLAIEQVEFVIVGGGWEGLVVEIRNKFRAG